MDKINKEKLIELLKYALMLEEKAVPIYNHHLESAIFWTGLSEDKAVKLKNVLELLAKESTMHKMKVDKVLFGLCKQD